MPISQLTSVCFFLFCCTYIKHTSHTSLLLYEVGYQQLHTLKYSMDQSSRTLNFTFLSIVNGLFFFIGIFLNSIVIVALLKSNQHLKSLCSFMILVVTCFDLATVVVCHPLIITSAYIWWTGDYDSGNIYHRVKRYSNILFHFSFLALLVMNIDRFLAVSCPFFHKQNVTRRRLMALLGVFLVTVLIERVLAYRHLFGIVVCHAVEAVFVGALLVVISFVNYEMYNIARAARRDVTAGVSTCILAVACFVLFSSPLLIYSVISFVPEILHEENSMLFNLWAFMLSCVNSSVNCLIFFWRDRRLREEGWKVLQSLFKRHVSDGHS